MKNKLLKLEIFSFIFTTIIGTLLHFTYNFSNNNFLVGSFSAVNESTWEHLKLLFFPLLIFSLISFKFIKKEYPNYLCIKFKSILLALIFIIIFFYTYTGIIGKNITLIDILSFFIAVFISHYYSYKNINNKCQKNFIYLIISLILISFILFTYNPPRINLFNDPVTNTYGIDKK